ncbi:SOS response-associated peptidase [Lysobacter korlensis]|uniref:Abasic site processing protein n=1 Tax=Lysobacter korlensis TaxID=553636 RepID=A0ABV6RR31_9GAMM
MRRFVQAFVPDALPSGLPAEVADALGSAPDRYNIAKRKPAAVIFDRGDGLRVEDFDWGLVPRWSKLPETRYTTVTARLERAPSSRIFKRPWESTRCVVPMTGYYKWDRGAKPARPYFIQPESGEVLFAAGLWDHWDKDEPELYSFAILTHRNPAIPPPLVPDGPLFMPAAKVAEWIRGPSAPAGFLLRMSQPALEAYPVSRRIRSPDVDDYTLLEPAAAVDPEEAGTPEDGLLDDDIWDDEDE